MNYRNDATEYRYLGRRVENLGDNVSAWCEKTKEGSSTHDVCTYHAEKLDANSHRYDDILKPYGYGEPLGEDGWGGDVEHPPYDDEDCRCAIPECSVLLGGY